MKSQFLMFNIMFYYLYVFFLMQTMSIVDQVDECIMDSLFNVQFSSIRK
jgi:hypothetical protein